jgi:hypothetical protein
MARIGDQLVAVWQLPHGVFKRPCGLRVGPRCISGARSSSNIA